MGEFLKKNWVTVLIVIATLVLAGIAVFTAIRLYQLRQTTVAPNAPSSRPAAAGGVPDDQCTLTFSLTAGSSTPTATPTGSPTTSPTTSPSGSGSASPTATATARPTATPVPPLSCGDSCTDNTDCTNSMVCSNGICRNPSCLNATNCVCSTTPAGTNPPVSQATAEPELPVAGTSFPTILGAAAGIILLLGAFVLAL